MFGILGIKFSRKLFFLWTQKYKTFEEFFNFKNKGKTIQARKVFKRGYYLRKYNRYFDVSSHSLFLLSIKKHICNQSTKSRRLTCPWCLLCPIRLLGSPLMWKRPFGISFDVPSIWDDEVSTLPTPAKAKESTFQSQLNGILSIGNYVRYDL